jgi:cysteate synthase
MTNYKLRNFLTGNTFDDTGWLLSDPQSNEPSLIRAIYDKKQLDLKDNSLGIYKFSDWLPINKYLKNSSATVTYKSKELAAALGLSNLFISFRGYWPDIGANMTTCSFKETEAYSVCARMSGNESGTMVVASAGNTSRAFAKVCSDNNIPLLLVIPEDNLNAMWFEHEINENVKLICTPSGTDYFDAIELSSKICQSPDFFEEGGAKNVARRDGMGTTVLSAVTTIGKIPDYYFQAIGSGTGTIAAWEANLRLIEDGRYGKNKMKLIPSQNIPFTPIYEAWSKRSREIHLPDEESARKNALMIDAKVLSNRKPPYAVPGGLFDALADTEGEVETVTNEELKEACQLFLRKEGIDIHPASGVALAGMIKAIKSGKVDKSKILMLNITGGGEDLFKATKKLHYMQPHIVIDNKMDVDKIISTTQSIF